MEVTRRDALAALAALGAGAGAVAYRDGSGEAGGSTPPGPADERVSTTMVALAEVVYPSTLTGIEPFVQTFLDGRLDESAHADGIRDAVQTLEERSKDWYDGSVASLDPANREALLRAVAADAAAEDPDGTPAERIRYYLVNELLLALYTSPTGGELVGLENPQGHPGGIESYARGPGST